MTVCLGLLSWPPLSWPCWLGFLVPEHVDISWLSLTPQCSLLNTSVWPWTHCPSARTKSKKDRTANRDRVKGMFIWTQNRWDIYSRYPSTKEQHLSGSIWYFSFQLLNPPKTLLLNYWKLEDSHTLNPNFVSCDIMSVVAFKNRVQKLQ